MLLTIDAGNTNIGFAVFDGDQLAGQWRAATNEQRTSDEYAVWLTHLMQMQEIDRHRIQAAVISTVVPNALYSLQKLCRDYFRCEPLVVGQAGVKIGIEAKVDRPSEVGADRLVNALGGYCRYGGNLVLIDFGTATTFDVVGETGDYMGGVIAPGLNLSLTALHEAAAQLPKVAVEYPEKVIGTSTVSAMKSGLFWGYMGLIEGIVNRIQSEYGKTMQVIATGGLARLFSKHSAVIDQDDPDLTLYGLLEIHNLNKKALRNAS